jgi:hypothetical protein
MNENMVDGTAIMPLGGAQIVFRTRTAEASYMRQPDVIITNIATVVDLIRWGVRTSRDNADVIGGSKVGAWPVLTASISRVGRKFQEATTRTMRPPAVILTAQIS